MSNFNVKYILPGDNKDIIILKTNYNFNQVLFNGIGKFGEIGETGLTGIIGQVGRDGETGITGDRASNWYFSYTEPTPTNSEDGDIWVNLGPTGYQKVFRYVNSTWGEVGSLLSTPIFGLLEGITGPGGLSEDNAVYINKGLPVDYNLALLDRNGETGDVNPSLSKLLIGTNSTNSNYPILAFGKTFQNQINLPGLYWDSSLINDYSIKYTSGGEFNISSGATASLSATGGTASFTSASNMNIESGATAYFYSSTSDMNFITTSSLNTISNNINVSTNSFNVTITGISSIINNTTSNAISYSGKGNGLYVSSNTGQNYKALFGTTGASGGSIFKIRNDGPIIIGSTGPSGATDIDKGLIVKDLQVTSYAVGPKFTKSGTSHSYVEVTPSRDNVSITPTSIGNTRPPVANGDSGRLYLSLGNDFSWIDLTTERERTLNFFLDSDKYSFGGIRMKQYPPWEDITVAIPDAGTGATGGCRHIELTFFSSNTKAFYKTFAGGNFSCGWLSYIYILPGLNESSDDLEQNTGSFVPGLG